MSDSVDAFLKRGGKIQKLPTAKHKPDVRSDYSQKDKIDVVTGKNRFGADRMFDQFAKGFLNRGNKNWKYTK